MSETTLVVLLALGLGAVAGFALGRRGRAALVAHVAALQARRDADLERVASEAELQTAFKALSADVLRESQRSFLEMAQATLDERHKRIGALVEPMQASLQGMDEKLRGLEAHRERAYGALQQQVRTMTEAEAALRKETANLVAALRPPHGRGRWGEIHLQRVVELADMREHCDFEVQTHVEKDEGQRSRPDMVVRLPGGKALVVDAKVPLKAYLDAMEAEDGPARERHLAEHARQVRERIRELAGKAYWSQFEDAPDFVVMYVPDEMFLSTATRLDPDLLEDAWRRKVIPASPTILITVLKTAHHAWQQERIAASAREISELGRELYERTADLGTRFVALGRSLEQTVRFYNETVGTLETRVLPSGRKFPALGVVSPKEIPPVPAVQTEPRVPATLLEIIERGG
jgi:DNA recombination protein RmuC